MAPHSPPPVKRIPHPTERAEFDVLVRSMNTPEKLSAGWSVFTSRYGFREFMPHDPYSEYWREFPLRHAPPTPSVRKLEEQVDALAGDVAAVQAMLRDVLRELEDLRSLNEDVRVGIGAIHSLNDGAVQLRYPLIYGYQEFEDDVLVSLGDLGITGAGITESEAVLEVQQQLWMIYQSTRDHPPEQMGSAIVRVLQAIHQRRVDNAVDG